MLLRWCDPTLSNSNRLFKGQVHYLHFTTVVERLFSDFVGFHELWSPISFAYPAKKESADNTVCVPFA